MKTILLSIICAISISAHAQTTIDIMASTCIPVVKQTYSPSPTALYSFGVGATKYINSQFALGIHTGYTSMSFTDRSIKTNSNGLPIGYNDFIYKKSYFASNIVARYEFSQNNISPFANLGIGIIKSDNIIGTYYLGFGAKINTSKRTLLLTSLNYSSQFNEVFKESKFTGVSANIQLSIKLR